MSVTNKPSKKKIVILVLLFFFAVISLLGFLFIKYLIPLASFILFDDIVGVQLARVMDTTVIRELRYVDGDLIDMHETGPAYAISIEVPETWIYEVRTHINGPTLSFEALRGDNKMIVDPELTTPLFTITALKTETFSKESEEEVWWDGVAAQTENTVFVWNAYGPEHEWQADVAAVIESIEIISLE